MDKDDFFNSIFVLNFKTVALISDIAIAIIRTSFITLDCILS
jgi:hypothetical protein